MDSETISFSDSQPSFKIPSFDQDNISFSSTTQELPFIISSEDSSATDEGSLASDFDNSLSKFGRTLKDKKKDGKRQNRKKKRANKPYFRLSPRVEKFPPPAEIKTDLDIASIRTQKDGYLDLHVSANTSITELDTLKKQGYTIVTWNGK